MDSRMTWWSIVEAATYVIAFGFGSYAIIRWRKRNVSVAAGLGIAVDRRTVPDFLAGLLISTAAMIGIFLIECGLGLLDVASVPFEPAMLAKYGTILLVTTLIEEFVMRGLLVSGLALFLGGRALAAVLINAAIFGIMHMMNPGASALSVLSNALGGFIYGLAFISTRRLWSGLGVHLAWNFVQGPVIGFPVSGHVLGGILRIEDLEPVWLTGGPYGPEGGAIGIAFRILVMVALLVWIRMTGRPGAERLRGTPNVQKTDADDQMVRSVRWTSASV